MTTRRLTALVLAAALLGACGTAGTGRGVDSIKPRDGRSGLQLSGTLDGRQVAVDDGLPVLRLGDCDVNDGADTDLCFFTKELDGGFFAIIIENPDAFVEGTVPVIESPCRSPHCDDVTGGVLVELQRAPGAPRTRATGGQFTVTDVATATHYAGQFNVEMPDGRFGGTFEVVPRPEPEARASDG